MKIVKQVLKNQTKPKRDKKNTKSVKTKWISIIERWEDVSRLPETQNAKRDIIDSGAGA